MKRSIQSNNYYWGRVISDALNFYTKNPASFFLDINEGLKGEEGLQVIHAMFKLLFNGGHSTRFEDDDMETGKEKMTKYIDKIREHFYHKHKFDISPANTPRIDYEANQDR